MYNRIDSQQGALYSTGNYTQHFVIPIKEENLKLYIYIILNVCAVHPKHINYTLIKNFKKIPELGSSSSLMFIFTELAFLLREILRGKTKFATHESGYF